MHENSIPGRGRVRIPTPPVARRALPYFGQPVGAERVLDDNEAVASKTRRGLLGKARRAAHEARDHRFWLLGALRTHAEVPYRTKQIHCGGR